VDSFSLLFLPFQLAGAAALGAFFAMERRLAGCDHDWRVLSIAGVAACVIAFAMHSITGAPSFDFMIVMGVIAFSAAHLLRDPMVEAASAWSSGKPAHMDFMTLASTFWAGAACGLGDLRGCILVVLMMAIVAMFWPQRNARGQATAAAIKAVPVRTSMDRAEAEYLLALAPTPGKVLGKQADTSVLAQNMQSPASSAALGDGAEAHALSEVHARTGEAKDAAEELSALARAIRAANSGHQAVVNSFESALAILEPAEQRVQLAPVRRARGLRHCHIAPHPWRAQGVPVERRSASRPLQRGNHKAL
jgi:hypothetical protein